MGRLLSRPKYRSKAEAIGDYGEKYVSSYLEDLPCGDYQVFNDLLICEKGHTTQIDHIVISCYGIFVLETKNYHGKIYGGGNAEYWKQYLPYVGYKKFGCTQEHQLRNPIRQNDGHIKALRRLVFGNDIPIYGIVVFPNNTEVLVTAEKPILRMRDVVPFIKKYKRKAFSLEQVRLYRLLLLDVISMSESDREQHLEYVYYNKARRDSAVANGICPRCGGALVLRQGKYGNFYGCSNYPRCYFILKN